MDLKEMDGTDGRQELLFVPEGGHDGKLVQIMPAKRGSVSEKQKDDEGHDPIAQSIGNYGKWQLKMTFLLSLCSFPCTFHIFSPTFIGAKTDFWCARPEQFSSLSREKWTNLSQPSGECTIYDIDWSKYSSDKLPVIPSDTKVIPCTNWEYDNTTFASTIVTEWSLVCDRDHLNTIADVLFLAGIAFGGVVSGMISDRFGRKKTLLFSVVMQTLLGLSITLCQWFELYLVLRITLGFFSVSVVFSAFVLIVELVGGKWRTISGVCNFFPLPVSYVIVSLMSMWISNWRMLQLALAIPGGLLISLWWIVPESPHWLLTMGRVEEVKQIIHQATAYNRRKIPKNLDQILQTGASNEEQATLIDLVRGKILKITVCLFIIWFATTLVYYGLVLNITSFGGNLYMTSILSGIVELPAIALSIPVLLKMGRRYPIALSLIIAGGCCLAIAITDKVESQWLKILLVMVSKFCIGATNGVLPTFTAELYPTLMRNMGVGTTQVSAGIGLVSIPYFWTLQSVANTIPVTIMGIGGIIGGLCVLLLPETSNKSLTQTVLTPAESPESLNNQNGPTNEKA